MLIDMTEMVCTGVVDDIVQLIAACRFPSEALFLAEKLPRHVVANAEERQDLLLFTYFDVKIPFAAYTSGRIFHPDFELRWEKIDAQMTQVVYVGTERDLPSLKVKRDLDLKKNELPKLYSLFGKRLQQDELDLIGGSAKKGDFAEVRIPRLLRYRPAPTGAQRVCLSVYEYVQAATGKVELFRFESLKAAE